LDLGNQPLLAHLANFSLPLRVARNIATGKLQSMIDHHPGDSKPVVFLALSKTSTQIPTQYGPFGPSSFDPRCCARAVRETSKLVAEASLF
jgi:hypothetical protein